MFGSIIKQEKQQENFFTFHLKSDKKNERGKTQVFTVIDLNLDQCLNFNEKIIVKLKHNNKNKFNTSSIFSDRISRRISVFETLFKENS